MGSRLQEGEGLTLMSSPLKSVLLTILQMGFDNEVGVCVDNAIPYPIEIIVSMPASMVLFTVRSLETFPLVIRVR